MARGCKILKEGRAGVWIEGDGKSSDGVLEEEWVEERWGLQELDDRERAPSAGAVEF
jgi:hypothetical protein